MMREVKQADWLWIQQNVAYLYQLARDADVHDVVRIYMQRYAAEASMHERWLRGVEPNCPHCPAHLKSDVI